MERRLGRGLGSLLGGSTPQTAGADSEGNRASELPVKDIKPNSQQPRIRFDEAALEGLRDSIKQHGVIQAIAVRRAGEGYELIAGERRLKAAKMAQLENIPVVIHEDVSDQASLEWAMVENLQREDLDPIERAKGFQLLMGQLGLKQEEVAARVGLKRSTVTNHLRLLELPEEVQEGLIQGLISMGHARALAGLSRAAQQVDLLERAVRQGLSVRQVEKAVRATNSAGHTTPSPKAKSGAGSAHREPWVSDAEARLREALETQVTVEHRKGGQGQLSIRYHDTEELDRLLNRLAPRRPL